MLSKLREPVNGLTHLGGALAAFVGLIVLLAMSWSGPIKLFSVLIYGLSLIALFSASATYHMVQAKPKVIEVLRKLDHAAIYLLIAGTYTPICLNAFTGFWRGGLLVIVWALALIGIIVKIFVINAPRWISAGVYLVMGWLCLAAFGQLLTLPLFVLGWLAVGGLTYTVGAVVYITKIFNFFPGRFGFHEVWHIFVLLGAAAHFVAVVGTIVG